MTRNRPNSERRKLLVLTSTFPRWAGDNEPPFVFELCRRLCPKFDVWVLAPHAPNAKSRDTLNGINVVRFRYFFDWGESLTYEGGILANLRSHRLRYLLVPLFLVFQLIAMLRLLGKEKFDIVHAHWLIPQGITAVIAQLCQPTFPALLCTAHGSDLHGLRSPLFLAIKRLIVRRCDALTTVSQAMKKHTLDLGATLDKTSVISMGVDTANTFIPSLLKRRSNDELLFVGRLSVQKGLELLIRAMPQVVAAYPRSKLKVVGQGPDQRVLQALGEALGVAKSIEFVGGIENAKLPEYYQKAALLVFPSATEEGFGLVCVEALACECPVIASDLLAAREIIQDGETGLLFPRGDHNKLASKIIELLTDPALRHKIGQAGRSFVTQRFDWEMVALRYSELLNKVS